MEILSSHTVTTPKGFEISFYIEESELKAKTPGGVATVKKVFAPHKNDAVKITIDENGATKTIGTSYEDAQVINALFNTVQKAGRELCTFESFDDWNKSIGDSNAFGATFEIVKSADDHILCAYKYSS